MRTGYLDETKRLYGVLEIRLQDRDWLAGPGAGVFSIADINVFPWSVDVFLVPMVYLLNGCHRIRGHKFSGLESLDEFPRLRAWVDRIDARPAVEVGVTIPKTQ